MGSPFGNEEVSENSNQFYIILDNGEGEKNNLQVITETSSKPHPQQQPVLVNPKQYKRILIRREARAKLESQGRIPKERKKFLHFSRHLHALNRKRGEHGTFSQKPPSKKGKESLASNIERRKKGKEKEKHA